MGQVELDSIQDYVTESDNLVALQQQIRGCDSILEKMESLLGGFQSDLGKISTEASPEWRRNPLARQVAARRVPGFHAGAACAPSADKEPAGAVL